MKITNWVKNVNGAGIKSATLESARVVYVGGEQWRLVVNLRDLDGRVMVMTLDHAELVQLRDKLRVIDRTT